MLEVKHCLKKDSVKKPLLKIAIRLKVKFHYTLYTCTKNQQIISIYMLVVVQNTVCGTTFSQNVHVVVECKQ